MPRKRKIPRTGGAVTPLQYTKEEFEAPTFTIVKYTQALRYRNQHVAQRDISEEEVREQYSLALQSLYHPEDAEYLRLDDQAESPAFRDYWSELADRKSYLQQKKARDPATGFRISTRMLTPVIMQRYPNCVVMDHQTLGVIIVPDLSLRSLNRITVKGIVQPILDANMHLPTLFRHMRPLCEAIIRRVFRFEEADAQQRKLEEMKSWEQDVGQLLESYRATYENNLQNRIEARSADEGRGSTEGDDDNEEDTDGDGPGPSKRRKRSKRSNLEEGKWLDFEKELGSASASTPAAPVSFQFPNMTLPFRNKE